VQFGISLPNFGTYHDPRLIARLAREAEAAGWDGFFLWDHVLWTWPEVQPGSDPYVLLTVIAMSTERIRFGALVTPIARRRPWKMARELTTLDQLSGGRVVLGVGIGGDWFGDYSKFGEPAPTDDKTHAEMLDEGLDVIGGLWSGEPFSFEGKHYKIEEAQFLPRPVQTPRIPVWIAGIWPHKKPFRRAAQWDGVLPLPSSDPPRELTAQETAELLAYIMEHRTSSAPFDVVVSGRTTGTDATKDAEKVGPRAEAGATWWIEGFNWNDALEVVQERIGHGPPRF
jgi:alkanesulfonate monooxygenase SsuD/methylene tetrahydromethanopterin reductase-like flavin-dependent oxidoreductase (luciferase family)